MLCIACCMLRVEYTSKSVRRVRTCAAQCSCDSCALPQAVVKVLWRLIPSVDCLASLEGLCPSTVGPALGVHFEELQHARFDQRAPVFELCAHIVQHATTAAPYCTVQYKILSVPMQHARQTTNSLLCFLSACREGSALRFSALPLRYLRCKARQGKARQGSRTCYLRYLHRCQQPTAAVRVCAADLEQIEMDGWHVWHRGQLASTLAWACLYRTMSASTSSSDDVYSECVSSSVTASSGSAQAHARVQRHIWRGTACSTRAV